VDQEENVEERVEDHHVAKPRGVRLWLSIAMVAFGALMVVAAAAGVVAERGIVLPGGMVLMLAFGYVAVGGSSIKVKGSSAGGIEAGVEMPQDTTVTTTIRKTGFPRQGMMPPKHGTMPPKEGEFRLGEPSDPSSGGAS
jgi:hypothetical protein